MAADTVARVETFLVASGGTKQWLFVRLETRDGVVGWGECYTVPDREAGIRALVEALAAHLVGREVHAIRHFLSVAYTDIATRRGSMDFFSAVSGLEQALWDAHAKALGRPVHELLGGPCRARFHVYANGWSYGAHGEAVDIDRTAARAHELVEQGWDALKLDPFPGPWRPHPSRADERAAVACIAAVRDAVGPEVAILVELHRRLAPAHAIRVARELEPYEPFWIEEPVPSTNLSDLRDVRERSRGPVVTGEELYGRHAFREVLERRAADVLNADVGSCGGILELTEIAAMAGASLVAVSPHNYNSVSVALAATIQASALMPNFLITEYFLNFVERSLEICPGALRPEGGRIALPPGPGLGVELDEAAVRRLDGTPATPRRVRTFRDEA